MRSPFRRASALLVLLLVAGLGLVACGGSDGAQPRVTSAGAAGLARGAVVQPDPTPSQALQAVNGPLATSDPPTPLAVKLDDVDDPVVVDFKQPPRSGLLFDLDTGEVLWRRDPLRRLPIASVTKMMTALLVARNVADGTKVEITPQAQARPGSRIGVLPTGKRVGVSALLNGLLILSGNDAAIALAQQVSGSVPAFVRLMNRQAAAMHLGCTSFASPDGLDDRGRSCAYDLAALGRAVLDQPRLAEIVKRPKAIIPVKGVKGGKIYMYSHDPLIKAAYRGTLGIKTGFTDAAGKCFVGAATRGGKRVGVILLHDDDMAVHAQQLLNRAWLSLGVA